MPDETSPGPRTSADRHRAAALEGSDLGGTGEKPGSAASEIVANVITQVLPFRRREDSPARF